MNGSRAFALGTAAGIVAICVAFPMERAACPTAAGGAAPAGCLSQSAWIGTAAIAPGLLVAFTVAVAIVSILREALGHYRLSSALNALARPATLAGMPVSLVPDLAAPFVAGLRRPTIYCAPDLTARLNAEELTAVLLHERHHQLAHAPARLVVLSGLEPFVGHMRVGRAWLEHRRAVIEIAADHHALRSGAGRSAIASALLKLDSAAPLGSLAPFATARELRLRALLREPLSGPPRPAVWPSAFPLALAAAMLCLLLPIR